MDGWHSPLASTGRTGRSGVWAKVASGPCVRVAVASSSGGIELASHPVIAARDSILTQGEEMSIREIEGAKLWRIQLDLCEGFSLPKLHDVRFIAWMERQNADDSWTLRAVRTELLVIERVPHHYRPIRQQAARSCCSGTPISYPDRDAPWTLSPPFASPYASRAERRAQSSGCARYGTLEHCNEAHQATSAERTHRWCARTARKSK